MDLTIKQTLQISICLTCVALVVGFFAYQYWQDAKQAQNYTAAEEGQRSVVNSNAIDTVADSMEELTLTVASSTAYLSDTYLDRNMAEITDEEKADLISTLGVTAKYGDETLDSSHISFIGITQNSVYKSYAIRIVARYGTRTAYKNVVISFDE